MIIIAVEKHTVQHFVYALQKLIDYEGGQLLGVFSQLEDAKAEAERVSNLTDEGWIEGDHNGNVYWRLPHQNKSWMVERIEVQ